MVSFFFFFFFCAHFHQEINFWLIHLAMNYVSRCFPFWFLNPLKYFFVQFLSRLLVGNPHSWSHSSFLLFISTVLVRLIYFCIFKRSVLFFVEILTFGFCLVTFECDAYLPVDHSLVYSYHKMFLLFFSLIFTAWAWFRIIFLDLYLVFLFLFSTACKTCFSNFDSRWMQTHVHGYKRLHRFLLI